MIYSLLLAIENIFLSLGDVLSSLFVGARYPEIEPVRLRGDYSIPRKKYKDDVFTTVMHDIASACKAVAIINNIDMYEDRNEGKFCTKSWSFSWQDGTNSSSQSWTGSWGDGPCE